MAHAGGHRQSPHIDLTFSSDDEPALPPLAKPKGRLGDDRATSSSSTKARRPPKIIDTDDSDEDQDRPQPPVAAPSLAGKHKKPVILHDSDDDDEDDDAAVAAHAPVAGPSRSHVNRKDHSRASAAASDEDEGDEGDSHSDTFIEDDSGSNASGSGSESESDSQYVDADDSDLRHAPVAQPARRAFAPPDAPFKAPLRSVSNTAGFSSASSSVLFNKSAATKPMPDLHWYGFDKVTKTPPAAAAESSSSAGPPSLKQRLAAQVLEQQKRIGIPISVPREGARGSPPAAKEGFAIDDERALNGMMADLNVADDASPHDQEAALKELVAGTSDMSSLVDFEPPDGLKCTLLPHQEIGVRWLVERETGKKRGGILGDDMGLGKTIQLIALMLANPSDRVKPKAKTTLIVCPVALMDQWKSEIATHTDGRLRVLVHHGASRTTEGRKLAKYDVVITSYPTLSNEWLDPNPKKAAKKGKGAAADDDDLDELGKLGKRGSRVEYGALFDLDHGFYRVILDEAHQIKNRTTKMQKACVALDTHFRWCLTGTPLQNEVMDLFSLFEFLGRRVVSPLHEVGEFKAKIQKPMNGKRTKLALARLGIILKAVMLRRRKTDQVDGRPLLALPSREIFEIKGPFLDAREAEFYEKIEEKMRAAMEKFKTADLMKNYTQVLVKLLRMRQACNHPSLVLKNATDLEGLELKTDKPVAAPTPSGSSSSTGDDPDDLSSMLGSMSLAPAAERAGAACAICSKSIGKSRTAAGESTCSRCEIDMADFAGMRSSTKVRRTLEILEGVRRESREASRIASQRSGGESDEDDDSFDDNAHVVKQGKGKAREVPLGPKKTIIFSQFTSMFDLLEPFLEKAGHRFVKYTGVMNQRERAVALDAIRNDPRCTVILVSLKCGAVGLNLTVCSRVILLDLWWNPAIEQQAFDRAHRYGQKDDVKIYKLVIDGTVEDRILTLQQQKAALAKAALDGEGEMGKAQKLGLEDILYLFRGDGRAGPSAHLAAHDDD
ncbi:uncharacterized protein RHOBADRAFT_54186 [Rhodotorula graminis WP1]|uniref:Uncharacterized protein n=1 Tax=Rhodotorula graminis (strain WP1) TaxID=578459 RepID=A0A194S168_RHOGW|nr:uncharacterized protein RHOBADRAFT_54186 [Rhodotorula graminis WP1]KPV74347.1 hypothetical protein RHOBADRAFT_54186 [Rhodotorula graminis WP1]